MSERVCRLCHEELDAGRPGIVSILHQLSKGLRSRRIVTKDSSDPYTTMQEVIFLIASLLCVPVALKRMVVQEHDIFYATRRRRWALKHRSCRCPQKQALLDVRLQIVLLHCGRSTAYARWGWAFC